MQCLWLDHEGLAPADREVTGPAGEIPVAISLAGICRTDLELCRGYMGFTGIPGHEFVGTALAGRWRGRRVTGHINCPCGECPTCLAGAGNHCPRRTVLGILGRQGAFAETLWLPEANLVPVPDHLPDRAAVFAEPLAAALHLDEQVELPPGSRVAVLGDGKLGLLCALALSVRPGVDVILIGRHREKLDRLAGTGVELRLVDREWRPEETFPLVVEATGRPAGLEQAIAMTAPLGTILLKSTLAAAVPLDTAPLVINEINLLGSRCGDVARAVEVLADGLLDPTPLVDRVFPLAAGVEAFACAGRPGVVKVLLEVGR